MCFHVVFLRMRLWLSLFMLVCTVCTANYTKDCSKLKPGQFLCPDPKYDIIDPKTQQLKGCTSENIARGKRERNRFLIFIRICLIWSASTYANLNFFLQSLVEQLKA